MYLGVVDWVGPVVSIIEHEYVDERTAVLSYGEERTFSQSRLGVPASCTNEPKGEASSVGADANATPPTPPPPPPPPLSALQHHE